MAEAWDVKEGDFPINGSNEDRLQFLLSYAILAPSSHNSQPWKFNVSGDEIRLYVDRSKWLKVADADQRELYISLGCAWKICWSLQSTSATATASHICQAMRI